MLNSTFKPIYTNHLMNCTKSHKNFISNDKVLKFVFEKNPEEYDYNGIVKIEHVTLEYENIGVYGSTDSSKIVYINGNPYFFTPKDPRKYLTDGEPYTIFTQLYGRVKINNSCIKKENKSSIILINLFHAYSNIFIVGMKITVTGTINGKPFTSTFPKKSNNETSSNLIDGSFLNFPMPLQAISTLAVNTSCPFDLSIINQFDLCLNCMQQESIYYAIPNADTDNPDNITTVGYFPLKFSFIFNADIFSSASRKIPLYLETVPFEDTDISCIENQNYECSECIENKNYESSDKNIE